MAEQYVNITIGAYMETRSIPLRCDRTPPMMTSKNDKGSILSVINPILNTSTNVVSTSSTSLPYVMIARGSDLKLVWSDAIDIDSGIIMYHVSLLTMADGHQPLYNISDCWNECSISFQTLDQLIGGMMTNNTQQHSFSFRVDLQAINGAGLSSSVYITIIIVNAPLFTELALHRVDTTKLSVDTNDAISSLLINGTSIAICSDLISSSSLEQVPGDSILSFIIISGTNVDVDVSMTSSSHFLSVSTSLGLTSQIDISTIMSTSLSINDSDLDAESIVSEGIDHTNKNVTISIEASSDIGSRLSLGISFITYNSSLSCGAYNGPSMANIYDGVPWIANSTDPSLWLSAHWDESLLSCHQSNMDNGMFAYEVSFGSGTGIDDIIGWTSLNVSSLSQHYVNMSILLTHDMMLYLQSYASVPIVASLRTTWMSSCQSSSSVISIHRSVGALLPTTIVASNTTLAISNTTRSSVSTDVVIDTTPPVITYIKIIDNDQVQYSQCQSWNDSLVIQWHLYDDESIIHLLWLAIVNVDNGRNISSLLSTCL
jgi:hypothetical protein